MNEKEQYSREVRDPGKIPFPKNKEDLLPYRCFKYDSERNVQHLLGKST